MLSSKPVAPNAVKRLSRTKSLVVGLLLAGTILGGGAFALQNANGQATAVAATAAARQTERPGFARLAAQVKPAVVTIIASGMSETPAMGREVPAFPPNSPFNDMFRRFFEQEGAAKPQPSRGLGSGFIIDPSGFVVTNSHVVAKADKITVRLDDEREFAARLVGRDARSDLALLKIDAPAPLPVVTLGDSDTAQIGDWVIAVGNPFGLGTTVTAGIVSARGRDIGSSPDDQFIQIDAPINRGNSGGPLFDHDGNVVGVNTAIISPTGGSVGIGFAIPSNVVRRVVAELRDNGRVERGWLGVSAQLLTPELAKGLSATTKTGALIGSVTPDSPAARAGLQPGDVVTAIDGKPVANSRDLSRLVSGVRPGSDIQMTIARADTTRSVQVKLGADPTQKSETVAGADPAAGPRLGVVLAPLSPESRRALGVGEGVSGVAIDQVQPGSRAEEAGLMRGDVITSVAGKPVSDADEVRNAIRQGLAQKDRPLVLQVMRGGHGIFVAVPTEVASG